MIYLLAKHAGLTVNAQSAGILTVLVFGAGTDYALLLVARYREELRRHEDRHEAMAFALHRAGPAIIASAAHRGPRHAVPAARRDELDPAASARSPRSASSSRLLAMITLLPALLVICGRWVFWPVRPRVRLRRADRRAASGPGSARGIARRPRTVWVGHRGRRSARWRSALLELDANGLSNEDVVPPSTPDSVVGEEVLAAALPGRRRARRSMVVANADAGRRGRDGARRRRRASPTSSPPVRQRRPGLRRRAR